MVISIWIMHRIIVHIMMIIIVLLVMIMHIMLRSHVVTMVISKHMTCPMSFRTIGVSSSIKALRKMYWFNLDIRYLKRNSMKFFLMVSCMDFWIVEWMQVMCYSWIRLY